MVPDFYHFSHFLGKPAAYIQLILMRKAFYIGGLGELQFT